MSWSFPIGRFLGSELRVHATFFLLLAWIAAGAWSSGGAAAALANTLFVLALFACVVAHEYGHALMARRYGIKTPDITLLPIGGMARMERMPEKPMQEVAVALAGPAVNVVIWAVLTGLGVTTDAQVLADPMSGADFLGQLAAVNLFLAVFNLIPAFPMDGGRVLRALLAARMDRVKATRLAANIGQVAAFLFAFWGITSGNLVLVLIAVFIFMAAQAEANEVESRSVAHGLKLRDAVITSFESLAPSDPMHVAGQVLIRTTQHEFPVLDQEGRLAGFLTRGALFQAMAEGHNTHPVAEEMVDVPQMPLGAPLEEALDVLAQAPAIAAVDKPGVVVGYTTRENVGELIVLRSRR
ncbi:site-2 protease family protein [Tropicibacter naphthalenivorans]|uniref:Zinc metalloprotease n=1 Tax=Tropicibacter naphthalenivorans TaxID=441103 RepID=A0A0N7LZA8_9RHOB|nr:site-2 protease family protein [Tropicibacter naphthalenivorans]CUH77145.1 Putative zinc metalloproteasec/MT2700 [Tropicibacter naphthalenivorans]SMC60321.1 stage IV sporulation protein FB [Tropicibacter naphthalenivorans]